MGLRDVPSTGTCFLLVLGYPLSKAFNQYGFVPDVILHPKLNRYRCFRILMDFSFFSFMFQIEKLLSLWFFVESIPF